MYVLLVDLRSVTEHIPTVWAQETHNVRGVTVQIDQGHTIVFRIQNVYVVGKTSEGDYFMTIITHRRTKIYPLHDAGLVHI